VSEREKGNCTKELEVQFLSSNSSDETESWLKKRAHSNSFSNTCRCGVVASGGKVGVCVRCCVQHRAYNLLTCSVSARLLASRLTMYRLSNTAGPCHQMTWPRWGDFGPRDLTVISLLSLRSFVDCWVPRASAGSIEAKGISQRLIPRPTTKCPCK